MKITRTLFQDLVEWKHSSSRMPLILKGVRQCGKTWLLKEFGSREFANVIYLNFERDKYLASFFEGSYAPANILKNITAYTTKEIHPEKTLLIFDEIQTCPRALNSLKYFCEEAPEYAIAAAGSLLGISLASQEGFPVGKVDFLELTPCTFAEYLETVAPSLRSYIAEIPLMPIPEAFAEQLSSYLKEYLAFGGMPAVLSILADSHDFKKAEVKLEAVLSSYESDFSKHIPVKDIPKLFLIWQSIPMQFARENRKFIFNEVREGARAKDLEDALQWLLNASMVLQVKNVELPELPLKAYEDRKTFKLYPSDVGILRHLANLAPGVLLTGNDIFANFKGKLAENFVLQQLHAMNYSPISYWTNATGHAEVDFVIQDEDIIVPIETKAGTNLKAQSLRIYRDKYNPLITVRTSMSNLRLDNNILNIPLYLLSEFPRLLKQARTQLTSSC